jgi:prepilin-type N-terminal cleavage/methylation domain-containing protein
MNRKTNKLAFSLIELSVVILIIGLLVLGVAKGSRIMAQSKLTAALALTQSSPIASTPDLAIWLETSDSKNIAVGAYNAGIYGNPSDQDRVSNWQDRSPVANINGIINVSAASDGVRPQYVANGIGGLPSINFDSSNSNCLSSTASVPLAAGDDDFTYIAVWNRSSIAATSGVMFEQNTNGALTQGRRASLLVLNSNQYGFNGESNDAHTIGTYIAKQSNITFLTVDNTGSVKLYHNSKNTPTTGSISPTIENVATNIFCVGAKCLSSKSEFFNGTISEIVIFSRVLKAQERQEIVDYLSRKYSIKVSN